MVLWTALFIASAIGMEAFAYAVHKHIMHGPLWCLHKSHHERSHARFERNDLLVLGYSLPSVGIIYLGCHGYPLLLPIGLGAAAYGVANALLHDVLVHRRIRHRWLPRRGYLGRIVRAHHMHHGTRGRDGAVSFGFFYVPRLPARASGALRGAR